MANKKFILFTFCLVISAACYANDKSKSPDCDHQCLNSLKKGSQVVRDPEGRLYFSCRAPVGVGTNDVQMFYSVRESSDISCSLIGETWGTNITDPSVSPSGKLIAAAVWSCGGGCSCHIEAWDLISKVNTRIDLPDEFNNKWDWNKYYASKYPVKWISDKELQYKVEVKDRNTREVVKTEFGIVVIPKSPPQ